MSGTRDKVTVTGSHSNKRDEGTTELTLKQRDGGSSSELSLWSLVENNPTH